MKNFKTIYLEAVSETVINKSRFIAYSKPVLDEIDAIQFIEQIKKKHWDATHNVPVYLLGENYSTQRYSDDGEPSGTAGVPILEMLKKEGVTNLCIVVTRYFGGVKLGTGGLVRAYTESAKEVLFASKIVDKKVKQLLKCNVDYHMHGKIQNFILNQEDIILKDTIFTDDVTILIYVDAIDEERNKESLVNLTSGNISIQNEGEFYLTIHEGNVI
jgi:uncharacterized protein, YigZ family